MYTSNHGGGCCGISHIRGFFESVTPSRVTQLRNYIRNLAGASPAGEYHSNDRGRLIEVVLNDREYHWHETLINEGFIETTSFVNSNSGRTITVYHYTPFPLEAGDEDMGIRMLDNGSISVAS